MTNLTKLFNYEGNEVTFKNENGVVYVNATQMGKPFSKSPKDYLRTQISKDLIDALTARLKCLPTDLVKVVNGGTAYGTWMHEDIAIDYAQWLSINFKLWCNDRLKELLTVGMTATKETLENMLTNPDLLIGLATQLKTERLEKEILQAQNQLASKTIQIQAPKVKFFDQVLQAEGLIAITEIAKELGFRSGKAFNTYLESLKVQHKVNGCYVLSANYCGKGYSKTKTHPYNDKNGIQQTARSMYWTELGRNFLIGFISKRSA